MDHFPIPWKDFQLEPVRVDDGNNALSAYSELIETEECKKVRDIQLHSGQNELTSLIELIKRIKQGKRRSRAQLKRLQRVYHECTNKRQTLKRLSAQQKERIEMLSGELEAKNALYQKEKKASSQSQKYSKKNKLLSENLKEKELEIAELEEKNEGLSRALAVSKKSEESKKLQVDLLKKKILNSDETERYKAKITGLKFDLVARTKDYEQLQKFLNEKDKKIVRLELIFKEKETQYATIVKINESLNGQTESYKTEIARLKVDLEAKTEEYEELAEKCQEIENSKTRNLLNYSKLQKEKDQKIAQLEANLKEKQTQYETVVKINESLNGQTGKIIELESQLKYNKKKLTGVELDMNDLKELLNSKVSTMQTKLKDSRIVNVEDSSSSESDSEWEEVN